MNVFGGVLQVAGNNLCLGRGGKDQGLLTG